MSKIALSSIAVAALALAAPAFAAGPEGTAANGTVPDTSKPKPKAEQRYCTVYTITGSILEQKVCKTRKEWLAEGVDPLAKQ